MEGKTYRSCVDPALEVLKSLHDDDELTQNPDLKNYIQTMQLDLRFFKMFFWGLEFWDETENDLHLSSLVSTMRSEFKQTAMKLRADSKRVSRSGKATKWEICARLVDKIKLFKPQVRESCIALFGGAFKCKAYEMFAGESFFPVGGVYKRKSLLYSSETENFIGFILGNLGILNLKIGLIAPVKQQIGFIEGKLKLFRGFAELVVGWWPAGIDLSQLLIHVVTWANLISFLACLYWIDEMDESLTCTTGHMLSDLMQITMPYTPEVIGLYLDGLKALFRLKSKTSKVCQLVANYVDFLLEDLDISLRDEVEILHEGLIFLLTFVMVPPKKDSRDRELILAQIHAIISEVPSFICSIRFDDMKVGIGNSQFSGFLQKIERVKADVTEFYVLFPRSTQFTSPRTNALGFLDFLLANMKKLLEEVIKIHFVKHRVARIQEELASLRPSLRNITELQFEHEELKDLLTRIISTVYYVAYVTNLWSAKHVSMWYNVICISIAIKDIKLIKIEVKNLEDDQIHNSQKLTAEMESSDVPLPQVTTSKIEGVIVGFKEDTRSILNELVRGRKGLTIISISGMPGQGKTTLAKRIYNDPSIQYHFHKIFWCYVSKDCKIRELLINILRDVGKSDVNKVDFEKILKLNTQDLVEHLRKSLKGKRYLIVMDDIWDVDVWRKVQGSFPDDGNGSRIMFTSRNHDLVLQAKPNSISHPLPLLSGVESWQLLKERMFSSDGCPPELSEIGQQIAIYCKGLTLAVVLIASLLERTEQKLDLWREVAENLKSHLQSEGCMHIIELSYKHLPNHLRPCFLYFGAFPRGKYIRAKKLKLLWIAEGFINENEQQRPEDLAKEYLDNLVCQSLVAVTERNSSGGIKTCNVHDLLYDLCLDKATEENFLQLADKSVVDESSSSLQNYDHYRLCIVASDTFTKARPICVKKELPTGQIHSLLWSRDDLWISPGNSSFLTSFKVLTVLDLEGMFLGYEFPKAILSMVNLSYLAIWARVKKLPPSIAELWNLETLVIREAEMHVKLPETMLKIKSLRHVNIDGCCVAFADSELEPASTIYNLERLSSPVLYHDSDSEKLLRRLPKLRKLGCYFGEEFHPRHASWLSIFRPFNKLETLRIDYEGCGAWFRGSDSEKFAGFNFPDNLKKLTLSGLKLPWSAMSTIGKIPDLEVLKLEKDACEGTQWDLEEGEFLKLRLLKLWKLDIEQLNVSSCDNPFPCLEELLVESCHQLEEIPSSFGYIYTLKTIKLLESHKANDSVKRILKEQQDIDNHSLQVLI